APRSRRAAPRFAGQPRAPRRGPNSATSVPDCGVGSSWFCGFLRRHSLDAIAAGPHVPSATRDAVPGGWGVAFSPLQNRHANGATLPRLENAGVDRRGGQRGILRITDATQLVQHGVKPLALDVLHRVEVDSLILADAVH